MRKIKIIGIELEYDDVGRELVFIRTDQGLMTIEELVNEIEEAVDVKGVLYIK